MLTAMFLSRYDRLVEHVNEIFLYRRALWTISLEKLFPLWYYNYFNFNIGTRIGGEPLLNRVHHDGKRFVVSKAPIRMGIHLGRARGMDPEAQPLLKEDERWLLWSGGS